jgi:hypothetical protein
MIVNLRDSVGHDYHNIFLRFAQLPLCLAHGFPKLQHVILSAAKNLVFAPEGAFICGNETPRYRSG